MVTDISGRGYRPELKIQFIAEKEARTKQKRAYNTIYCVLTLET